MKYSEAILKGFQRVGGRQYTHVYFYGADPANPIAACVLGALHLGLSGSARPMSQAAYNERDRFREAFAEAWGEVPDVLNDLGMPWEDLYGMSVAAGL